MGPIRSPIPKAAVRNSLGNYLRNHVSQASSSIVLIAPFIKYDALDRVLKDASLEADLTVVTRWRPSEIAVGVSDIDVYQIINDFGGELYLRWDLHAKYYRSDEHLLIGSANLTSTALGWVQQPNLEILVETDFIDHINFEREVMSNATQVNSEVFSWFQEAALDWDIEDHDPTTTRLILEPDADIDSRCWIPLTRMPEDLFTYYESENADLLTDNQIMYAAEDLARLGVPNGLNVSAFRNAVRACLGTTPFFQDLDYFLSKPRRFGEVRQYLVNQYSLTTENATIVWQTTIRWLNYFFPDRYIYKKPRHSEIIERRT